MDYLKILNKNYDVLIDDKYDNLMRCRWLERRYGYIDEANSLVEVNGIDIIPSQFAEDTYPHSTIGRQIYYTDQFSEARIFHRVHSLTPYRPFPLVAVKVPPGYRWRASWCTLPPTKQAAVLTVFIKKTNGTRFTNEELRKLLYNHEIEFVNFSLLEDSNTKFSWDSLKNHPTPRLAFKKMYNREAKNKIQGCGIQIFGKKRLLKQTFYPNRKPYDGMSSEELDIIFDSEFEYLNIIDSVHKDYSTKMNTYRKEDVHIFEVAPKNYKGYTPLIIPTSTVSASVWGVTFTSSELNGQIMAGSGFVEQYFETKKDNSIQVVAEQKVYENLHPAENNTNTRWSGVATLSYLVCV